MITLIMLIPTALIQQLIKEREYVKEDAISEVSVKWGNGQTITGPYISIPYQKTRSKKEWVHFLPEHLKKN